MVLVDELLDNGIVMKRFLVYILHHSYTDIGIGHTMKSMKEYIMSEMNIPATDITTCVAFSKQVSGRDPVLLV